MNTKNTHLLPVSLRIVAAARQRAVQLHNSYVGTEHLLLALLDSSEAEFELMKYLILNTEDIRQAILKEITSAGDNAPVGTLPIRTPRFAKVLALSDRIARGKFKTMLVSPTHLLLGILNEGDGMAARILKKTGGLTYDSALAQIPGSSASDVPTEVDMLPGLTQQLEVVKVEKLVGRDGLELEIKVIRVNTHPATHIFCTELSTESTTWPETFGSLEQLNAYIRGIRAMASTKGEALLWELDLNLPRA